MIYDDGAEYDGQVNEQTNSKDGKGILYMPNGDIHEGNWQNGEMNGNGRIIKCNGNIHLGQFNNNLKHG